MKKHTVNTMARPTNAVCEHEIKNAKVAYEAALESIVLLENDGALPVKPGKIALYGNGVWKTLKGGTGSGEVNERHSVTILEGMEKAGFSITSSQWLSDYQTEFNDGFAAFETRLKEMMTAALKKLDIAAFGEAFGSSYEHPYGRPITQQDVIESDTDTCIYVLSRQSGENMDRDPDNYMFHLVDEELEHIRFCAEHYEKTIVVLNVGISMDVQALKQIPGINALVHMGLLGSEGGRAFADVISGKVSPSGHLASTWVKSYDDVPFSRTFGKMNPNVLEQDYQEGIYVGYRYYDTFQVEPQYPFGYGLSYTQFSMECIALELRGSKLAMQVRVTNTGSRFAGKEVVQVYVSCPQGSLEKPMQQLAAFGKTRELRPQEFQTVELEFDFRDQASYFEADASYRLEKGDYIVRIGASSRMTTVCAAVHLGQDVTVSRHNALGMRPISFEELHCQGEPQALDTDVQRLCLNPAAFETVTHTYQTPAIYSDARVTPVLNSLTVPECIDLVVGDGLDITGKPHEFICLGASGYTTSKLVKKGIPNVALCDGPAGLRLQVRSAVQKDRLKPADPFSAIFGALPKWMVRMMTADPEKSELVYQYATAFPAGHSVAQSWNTDLVEQVGRAVSLEMSEYGVTFWLAPGVNIQRNPLCGRNFEYYSEDPLLAGKMAAAVTRGVQSRKGNYVAMKHFFCNNQEEARNHMSSNVSERVLREIYLRAFRIAVQEGNAKGIMSSYNRVNGVYTANHYPCLTDVLRNEWGFDGLVMTDWMSTDPKCADAALCMSAGNDLLMCGMKSDKKAIRKALASGKIQEKDLRRCAANVIKLLLDARTQ